jgi:hypothetical protein
MWKLFERGAAIHVDGDGNMTVSSLDMWPESCPKMSREALARVDQGWQPFLDRVKEDGFAIMALADPDLWDGWQPDGPVLELSFRSSSGQLVQLMWDYRSSLPADLEDAVLGTLEELCSNSRRAKKYLLRDLPQQVAVGRDCQRPPSSP